jgi:hypothetical protein
MDEPLKDPVLKDVRIQRLVLYLLLKGEPINMREFVFAAEISINNGKPLRERMEELGLLMVSEPKIRTGTDLEIRLTKEGEEVGRKLLETHHASKRARAAAERK